MDRLLALLSGKDDTLELDRAALELARIEYPELDPHPFLELLDSYAFELGGRLGDGGPREFVERAGEYLFNELGFAGNVQDYYDPKNSCLNDVLTRRTGIPISLSVVYMEVARRLAKPVYGIGLPAHFMVRYDDGEFTTYIDPFHGGALLDEEACFRFAQSRTGTDLSQTPAIFQPVTTRQIVLRMLNNLRSIYFQRRAYGKALQVMDLLIAADPDSAEEFKQRAHLQLVEKKFNAARADLEEYLRLAPLAQDREQVRDEIRKLRRFIAGLN